MVPSSQRRKMLCFVHIEKAAGTTLHHILSQNFKSYMRLSPFFWPSEEQDVTTASELKGLLRFFPFTSSFGGHCVRSFLGYGDTLGASIDYITFVREPHARFRSHFLHQREHMGIPWSLDRFLAEPRFHNIMTRKICGQNDVAAAKQALADYAFVGLLEKFDESMILLRKAISWRQSLRVNYSRENVAPKERYQNWSEQFAARQSQIEEVNALDMELYRFVKEELYPKQVASFSGDLEAEVAELRRQNQQYRFSPLLRNLQRFYRAAGYSRVEAWLRSRHHGDQGRVPTLEEVV